MSQHLSIGDKVKVIDPAETPSEWAEFIILSQDKNRFLLTTIDRLPTYEPFWVKAQQIFVTTPSS